jgi:mRNA-degrading endonuclease RelE of RelBE toxin-antitoxin system
MKAIKLIRRLPEFEKDLKKLAKRVRTLEDDLRIFRENELRLYHELGIDNQGIFPIPTLGIARVKIFKVKKFACRALKGKGAHSGIRVIYAFFEKSGTIDLIEIYYKGDKENEDRQRIRRHFG